MDITYNLDPLSFTSKPNGAEVGAIRQRSASHTVTTTPEELLTSIEHGHTFTPAKMHGTTGNTWDSQQIIVADIDNNNDAYYMPANDALDISLKDHHINPYCIYTTFSHTEKHPKYRMVVILEEPLTDPKEAEDLTRRYTAIFNEVLENCADTSIKDNARIIYGTKPGRIVYNSGAVTPLTTLRKLPEARENTPETAPNVATLNQYAENARSANNGNSGRFDLIPLLDYIDADDYDTWLKVGMALKAEGYTVDAWDTWSRTSTKYKPAECFHKWDSFDTRADGVTGAYITMLAKQGGYIPPKDRPENKPTPWNDAPAPEDYTSHQAEGDPGALDPITGTPENAPKVEPVPEPTPDAVLDEFLAEIQSERFKPIKTGLDSLDRALDDGLERKTLVTLASAPGVGKTAFSQYLFENMARAGHSVIYVNLEMDRSQLLSRSIARIAYEHKHPPVKSSSRSWEETARQAIESDITALTVRRGYKWTDQQRNTILKALEEYRENIAPRFHYVTTNPENSGAITRDLSAIMNKLERLTAEIEAQGLPAPLVCIDYLQFVKDDLYTLDPTGKGKKPDTAEAIAEILGTFKAYAMKHSTVVLLIMANNRASNKEGRATMDSGRDTSNIEYSGDIMLSLTYTAIEDKWQYKTGKMDSKGNDKYDAIDNDYINFVYDVATEHDNTPDIAKHLCIKVVKGRGISPRKSARFIYEGKYASFKEDPEPTQYGHKYN